MTYIIISLSVSSVVNVWLRLLQSAKTVWLRVGKDHCYGKKTQKPA